MMTLIASEGLPDCVSDGVRHQVSAMVTEVSAQKLAHERLAARLELAEREVRQHVSSCALSARRSVPLSARCFSDARRRRLGQRLGSRLGGRGDVTCRARCGASRGA
jgi:hypothetical protein